MLSERLLIARHSADRNNQRQLLTKSLIGLNLFTVEPEFSGLVVTCATNDHIEQNNAIVFAKYSIHIACDQLVAVAAKELHAMAVMQHACQRRAADQAPGSTGY